MKKLFLFLPALLLLVASCSRDGAPSKIYVLTDDDKGFGSDHGKMEAVNGDIEALADGAMYYNELGLNVTFNGCVPTVIHDTNLNLMIIDFGAECKDANNNNRTGKIIVTYDLPYWDSGSIHRITFDNYKYNGDRLAGYKVTENRGFNGNGKRYFSVIVADTLYPAGSGDNFISYYSERETVWVTGYNTKGNTSDDVYEVNGSGSMKRANNQYCDFNILTTLLVSNDCKYVRSGVMQIIPKDGYARTIDYGSGDCNDDAKLDINGMLFDVKL
ncbi:MAG TPA: hypothetical protein VEB40_13455 [Flavipsychrobacter sp.]|nr:hypothetical protein [Flavipsychrobacter sp.]